MINIIQGILAGIMVGEKLIDKNIINRDVYIRQGKELNNLSDYDRFKVVDRRMLLRSSVS